MGFLDRERFAVFGLARSGVAAANFLARRGKKVVASDIAALADVQPAVDRLHPSVDVVTGRNEWATADVIVLSPGLKPSLPLFDQIPDAIPLVSEIELAREGSDHRWLAITGTDGKTTTTELTAHLLEANAIEAVAAGNIGTPLCDVVDGLSADAVVVAEVSAFQLWSTHRFSSHAAAVTNIADDHLDYFDGDVEAYVESKRRILRNAGAGSVGVFNVDDRRVRSWLESFEGRAVTFGTTSHPDAETSYTFDGRAIHRDGEEVMVWAEAPLVGRHNAFNTMAAFGLCRTVGLDDAKLVRGLATFEPLPHRIERVGEVDGVVWINDSKATNAHAAMAGLEALVGDLVVIAGGVDKGLDLGPFATYLTERGAEVVLIGELRERLTAALLAAGISREHFTSVASLSEAVAEARKRATPGGTVVLSPACSSFDMFASYADRGEQFRALVSELI